MLLDNKKNGRVGDVRDDAGDLDGDLGFKVFKLDSSNIGVWNPDRSDLEQTLLDHTEHLVEGRSEEDVLYELLLKRGVDLTVPIEAREVAGKAVYSIGYGVLFACLDTAISRDEVENVAQGNRRRNGVLETDCSFWTMKFWRICAPFNSAAACDHRTQWQAVISPLKWRPEPAGGKKYRRLRSGCPAPSGATTTARNGSA